jgi:hypothetical protein
VLIVLIWYAIHRGQDFNWDQQNYHIGIPFLLAHNTFWTSIAPAGIQSYLNPFVLQAQFFALRHFCPIGFAVTLALLQSSAFLIAGLICAQIDRPTNGWQSLVASLLGFSLCLMSPISLSEAGTTLIDLVTAVPVLAAYSLLLARGQRFGLTLSSVLAGILLGTATALKLTNAVFAIGALGFAIAGRDSWPDRLKWIGAYAVVLILSFAAVGGSWQLPLWEQFGNPFFPYYNGIFHSPDFAPKNLHDQRFLPQSVLDVWRYPVRWLLGGSPNPDIATPSSELAFRDARWTIAVFAGTIFIAGFLFFRRWAARRLLEPATGLLFAFSLGYLIWLFLFGYQRYVLPLEILSGVIILFLSTIIVRWARIGVLFIVAVVSWQILLVPDWGHLPWRSYWQAINPDPIEFGAPAIVFLGSRPSSFIVASLPTDTRYIGVYGPGFTLDYFDMIATNDTYFTRQLKQELSSEPKTPLKEVDRGAVPMIVTEVLASYALRVTDRCELLLVGSENFRICDVVREG